MCTYQSRDLILPKLNYDLKISSVFPRRSPNYLEISKNQIIEPSRIENIHIKSLNFSKSEKIPHEYYSTIVGIQE